MSSSTNLRVDKSGQMVLIMKLHALAWNYHDGHIKPELLTDSQKERAVYKLPEFIDYAGYVFFFPSIFTGPAFDVRREDENYEQFHEKRPSKPPVNAATD